MHFGVDSGKQIKPAGRYTFPDFPILVSFMTRAQGETQGCHGCVHFYITYDPSFPYGCRVLQFKSRRLPHLEVQAASQTVCQAREAAPPRVRRHGRS